MKKQARKQRVVWVVYNGGFPLEGFPACCQKRRAVDKANEMNEAFDLKNWYTVKKFIEAKRGK